MDIAWFALGLALLVVGAEWLVRGASKLAERFGVSPLVIGLTVVAFGTSAPELAVSLKAALAGDTSIAVGNVVGSNIFNVLFILGLSALICPLVVAAPLIRFDVPLLIVVSGLVYGLAADGSLSRGDGGLLTVGLFSYTGFLFWTGSQKDGSTAPGLADSSSGKRHAMIDRFWVQALAIVAGLSLLIVGSQWLVGSATVMAKWLGVSDIVIGLTVVAAGTSLPEVVTSVVASLRGERDIAVGNVIGSNLFNLFGVLGLSSLVTGSGIPVAGSVLQFDLPLMWVTAVVCLPIFFTQALISRWEGGFLLVGYVLYTIYLVLDASHSQALPHYQTALVFFAAPLVGITILAVLIPSLWPKRSRKE